MLILRVVFAYSVFNMALEKLLLLCAASLAFFDSEGVAKAETNPTLTLNSARNCLANMNAARKKAGLVALTEVTEKIKKEDDFQANSFEKALCDALLKGEKFMLGEDKLSAGTYAFYELTESADKDENDKIPDSVCSAAVKKWQGGFSLFGQNSPVKENFTTTDAFSFLTLYNPSSVPEGECKVAICDGTQVTQKLTTRKSSALVCLTSPSALTKQPIFSEAQWEQIAKVFSSSASGAVPSALAFAAVLAGMSLF
uniref:Surface antigen 11 n=1 Tax=Eimeria stiedai TaxID=471275 RepID=A0A6H0C295_9EIME|nr:surface antigen 11 [Eimeria stiedai]